MKLVAQMNGSQCSLTCSRFRMAVIAPVMIRVMPRPRISPMGGEELEFYHDSCGVRLADEAGIHQVELKEDPHLGQALGQAGNSLGIRGAWRQTSAVFPS